MGWGGGWGGVVGEMGNKAISAFNQVEVQVEAELGKKQAGLEVPHSKSQLQSGVNSTRKIYPEGGWV